MSDRVPYVGGPFDGGHDPTGFMDTITVWPAACTGLERGRYVLGKDDRGHPEYRWEPYREKPEEQGAGSGEAIR